VNLYCAIISFALRGISKRHEEYGMQSISERGNGGLLLSFRTNGNTERSCPAVVLPEAQRLHTEDHRTAKKVLYFIADFLDIFG